MITRGGGGGGVRGSRKRTADAAAREERRGGSGLKAVDGDGLDKGEVGRPLEVQIISCENLLEMPLCYWSHQSVTFNQLDF